MTRPLFCLSPAGDSNNFSGAVRAGGTVDRARSNVYQYRYNGTIELVGDNPIESADTGIGSGNVGPYVQFCHMMEDAGKLPSGYDWLIMGYYAGGTSFADGSPGPADQWSALDNPGGVPGSLLVTWKNRINAGLTAAKLVNAASRPCCLVWNEGANCGANNLIDKGMADYGAQHRAMYAYIRANCPGWEFAPWLEIPTPYDYGGPIADAGSNHYVGQLAYKQDIANQVGPLAQFVDTYAAPILRSDAPAGNNSGRHYSAGSHRGTTQTVSGIDDTNGYSHQVLTPAQSVAGRMLTAYNNCRRPVKVRWNT